jgi:hypothetical protein
MNKAWITYLGMLATLGAGMWAILYAGSRLQAPPDLRGRWVVESQAGNPGLPFDSLSIEQSGLFFNLQLREGNTLCAVLRGRWNAPAHGLFEGEARSSDGKWNLRLGQNGASEELRGELTAPPGGKFIAHKEPENPAVPGTPG